MRLRSSSTAKAWRSAWAWTRFSPSTEGAPLFSEDAQAAAAAMDAWLSSKLDRMDGWAERKIAEQRAKEEGKQ
jgi:hypothetical protein